MRTGTLHILFGFFAALFVASQVNIIAALGPVAPELFQLQVTLSADAYRGILEGWGADDLVRYRTHLAWDTVHPLIYGALLVLWIYVLHHRREFSPRGTRWLLTLALAPSALDYLENAFHLYLEVHREAISPATVLLSGGAAILKWLCAALVVFLLLMASVRALFRPRPASVVSTAAGTATANNGPATRSDAAATRSKRGAGAAESATAPKRDATTTKPATATPRSTGETVKPAVAPRKPATVAAVAGGPTDDKPKKSKATSGKKGR